MKPNVRVITTTLISPQIKRIRFQGDISKWSFEIGYASVVRVSETEFRNYTVAFHDKEEGVFDILFHIHGEGVGSRYIDMLKANDELFISPPRGKDLYNPGLKQQFFFGDETSLGVAAAFLPVLKKNGHQFRFYFELHDENREVPELLKLEEYTIFPKNNSFREEKWVAGLPFFKTDHREAANFALVGNVRSVQTFRKVLKDRTQGTIHSQGYWLEGKKGL